MFLLQFCSYIFNASLLLIISWTTPEYLGPNKLARFWFVTGWFEKNWLKISLSVICIIFMFKSYSNNSDNSKFKIIHSDKLVDLEKPTIISCLAVIMQWLVNNKINQKFAIPVHKKSAEQFCLIAVNQTDFDGSSHPEAFNPWKLKYFKRLRSFAALSIPVLRVILWT